jgi:hypothetical protein
MKAFTLPTQENLARTCRLLSQPGEPRAGAFLLMTTQEALYDEGWRSPDTYDPEFSELPEAPAVYLVAAIQLWPGVNGPPHFEVAYVGMSENVSQRLDRSHAAMTRIEEEGLWPKRFFKMCEKSELRRVERQLIRFYQPRLNIIGKAKALK